MSLHVMAVGTRMPKWVQLGTDEYTRRMPTGLDVQWQEIRAETRSTSTSVATCMEREAQRIRRVLPKQAWLVLLDENGKRKTTREFADRLAHWQSIGRPICLVIGGPDGLSSGLKSEANDSLRLSDLTLPHPLVRIVLAEQLYRASTILDNHPYHRD
ncbi:MAG: 23S rRNA (pseudouridine(1915)-N(3))-methyltransferase RlmH [Burkholderiaceae bacterium]